MPALVIRGTIDYYNRLKHRKSFNDYYVNFKCKDKIVKLNISHDNRFFNLRSGTDIITSENGMIFKPKTKYYSFCGIITTCGCFKILPMIDNNYYPNDYSFYNCYCIEI